MSPHQKPHQLRSASSGETALVLEMVQQNDRFVSTLHLVSGTKSTAVVRSVEGDDKQTWPASSPLREVVPQSNSAGPYLAGVGGAGTSHWSVIATSAQSKPAIELDFACRAKSQPGWIGSTYEILNGSATVNGPTIEIRTDHGLVVCAADTSDVSCKVDIKGGQLLISAPNLSPESIPCTIRWKYWFSLA